ncbi:MAG: NAD(P)-dependent oxidoreductase [Propionivibrio sp.]
MKRVVLLGATSMLGREVERQLRLVGMDVTRAGRSEDCDVVIDLGSGKPLKWTKQCEADVLIHCAAAFYGDDPEGIQSNFRTNVLGAVDTLELAKRMGCDRIVYAGSLSSEVLLEPERPMTSYGMSKLEAERVLNWGVTKEGGTFCSLRFTQLCDTEGLCCMHQPWFGRIIAYASRGLILRMPESEGPRNFLHVSDAARLLIESARSNLSGVYSVTHPRDVDLYALALEACEMFGQGGQVQIDGNKQPFRKIFLPDDRHVFDVLSLEPEVDASHVLRLIQEAGTASRFGPVDVQ